MRVHYNPNIVFYAFQWFKNGDHPDDHCKTLMINGRPVFDDGSVVRRFYGVYAEHIGKCQECELAYNDHGLVDNGTALMKVCPGDWIVSNVKGFHDPVKPLTFKALYVPYDGA